MCSFSTSITGDSQYLDDQVSGGSSLEQLNCIVANIPLEENGLTNHQRGLALVPTSAEERSARGGGES